MKKITLLLFVALFALNSYGQTEEKRLAAGFGPGYYINLSDDNAGGFTLPNFFISTYLNRSLDLRGKLDAGLRQSNEKGTKVNYFQSALDLRLKLYKDKPYEKAVLQPYIYAGPGFFVDNANATYQGTDYNGGINFNGGVGTKLRIGPAVALYLEAGYIHGVTGVRGVEGANAKGANAKVHDNFLKLSSIIEFDFTDNDRDNDGVKNKEDECPDTPGLAKFNGCPDTDGDGVPDPKDKCPGTPQKCWPTVDENGCPKDTDGDGLVDCEDDCPNAAGPKEFKGCPDTDGDGVIDKNDECPNTPKGCKVDTKGCPLDRDKDGVIDCQDDCPDEPGLKELKGCPVRCKDFTIDNIHFDFDKAVLRPEGIAVLDGFVSKLGDCKEFDVLVNGHTCDIGTKFYNQGLSEKRAQVVVKYLISKGVNAAFVTGKGYGETEPAVPNTNKTNREQNRRAMLDLIIK